MPPLSYFVRRTVQLGLVIFIAVSINFFLPRLLPGDPVQVALQGKILTSSGTYTVDPEVIAKQYMGEYGLNKPVLTQYLTYWQQLFHGNLGVSLVDYPRPVTSMIRAALPWTLSLLAISVVISFIFGSLLGGLLAWPHTPKLFRALAPGLVALSVIPYYLLAVILIFLFSTQWRLLPGAQGYDPTRILGFNAGSGLDILRHAILPSLSIVVGSMGFWALSMRGTMVSVLGDDYITFAEAKGLSPRRLFLWYGMRNALLPQITALAVALGVILSGAVLVEVIFNYPGLGYLLYNAVEGKDYFVIQGIVLMLIISLALALYVVDLIYPLLDPRITYRRG
jgi:peptide/nickel transport system permease protein